MKYILTLITFFVFINNSTISAWSTDFELYQNESIPSNIRDEITVINDKIFDCIENRDPDIFFNEILSDSLRKRAGYELKSLIQQLSMTYDQKGYNIKDEFYTPLIDDKQVINLIGDINTNYEYSLNIGIGKRDSYFSLLRFNDNTIMVGLLYRKREGKWQLDFIGVNQYSIKNKLPYDYYMLSINDLKKGHLIDAALYASLSTVGLKPNNAFTYSKEQEILSHSTMLDSIIKSKYIFPITVEELKTKPQIFQVIPQIIDEGIFPMVNYLTEINISDTIQLRIENEQMKMIIGDIFPGIDKEKEFVFYTAHDNIPTQQEILNVYGFVQEIE